MLSTRIVRDEHVPFETENVTDKELKVISQLPQRFRGGKSRAQLIKQCILSLAERKLILKKCRLVLVLKLEIKSHTE